MQGDAVTAVICTTGAALVDMTVDAVPVVPANRMRCAPEQYRGSMLAPWPGRLADGCYQYVGQQHTVPVNDPITGCALHGLAAHRKWDVAECTGGAVVLTHRLGDAPGYPFPVALRTTYQLRKGGLHVALAATNQGRQPAPVGLGAHPYMTAGTTVDETILHVPAETVVGLNERGLPEEPVPAAASGLDFRVPRRIGGSRLDLAYTDLSRDRQGRTAVTLAAGDRIVSLVMGAAARWVTIFTADTLEPPARRSSIAVEPMTCPANALRSGVDLDVLDEGETLVLDWDIYADSESGTHAHT